jgi:hypothetical protein
LCRKTVFLGQALISKDRYNKPKKIQIKYQKSRAKKNFTTLIFKRNKNEEFDVITSYLKFRKKQNITGVRADMLFPSPVAEQYKEYNKFKMSSFIPMHLLGIERSSFQQKCIEEISNDEALPFIEMKLKMIPTFLALRQERTRLMEQNKHPGGLANPQVLSIKNSFYFIY